MSIWAIISLLLLTAGAAFVQRVTGFGFGIFIMTALPYIMPSYAEATALSGLLALVTVLHTAWLMRSYCPWRKLIWILLSFLVASCISIFCVKHIGGHELKHILGGILILVSLYFFFLNGRIHIKPSMPVQIGMGTLSGLMGGFFAMQGPPAVLYFLSCSERKEEYTALVSFYFAIGNAFMTIIRASNGFVTPVVAHSWLIALPAVLAGLWLGSKVYKRMPIEVMRKCCYAFMGISGLITLFV